MNQDYDLFFSSPKSDLKQRSKKNRVEIEMEAEPSVFSSEVEVDYKNSDNEDF